jgi:transketolase
MLDPDAPEGESLFDHTIWCFASDGDLEEGVSGEASSLAGTQRLGNLVLVYDANKISIEDDTTVAFTEDVGKRYEAYGWHVQHVDDGEDLAAVDAAFAAAKAETGRPSIVVLHTVIAWPAPNKQNTGASHGSALGEDEVRATKEILGFDPEQTFQVDDEVLAHARSVVDEGRRVRGEWDGGLRRPGGRPTPTAAALIERMTAARSPEGWAESLPSGTPIPKGVATRKASGECSPPLYPELPSLWGGWQTWRRATTPRSRAKPSLPAGRPPAKMWFRRALRPHPCTSASASTPDGRDHERDRAARRHPRLRRHVPHLLRLHARSGAVWPRSCSCR